PAALDAAAEATPAAPPADVASAEPAMPGTPSGADKVAQATALGRVGAKPQSRLRQKTLLGAFKPAAAPSPPAELQQGRPQGLPGWADPSPADRSLAAEPTDPIEEAPRLGLEAEGIGGADSPTPPKSDPGEDDALESVLLGAMVGQDGPAEGPSSAEDQPLASEERAAAEAAVLGDGGTPALPVTTAALDESDALAEPKGIGVLAAIEDSLAGGLAPSAPDVPEHLSAEALAAELPPAAAADGSPWRTPSQAPPAAPTGPADEPLPWWQAVVIALLTAVIVATVGVLVARWQLSVPATAADDGVPSAEPSTSAAETATSRSSSAPSASAGPTASTSVTATASAAAPTADGRDGSELPANRGYLIVHFDGPTDGQVFLSGKKHGVPDQKLDVPCGRTFVRVGKLPGPQWLSLGAGLEVVCQSVTEITLEQP
ncbi:MAG: hypothetical protein JRI23_34070, partial [Deltaproteobacteria bacterium]|nr:hypothetical protein [Deltaproteobacteria bacterium]MBW2537324.1 hypothetical protein [Deltaproteobacteria bacterium]